MGFCEHFSTLSFPKTPSIIFHRRVGNRPHNIHSCYHIRGNIPNIRHRLSVSVLLPLYEILFHILCILQLPFLSLLKVHTSIYVLLTCNRDITHHFGQLSRIPGRHANFLFHVYPCSSTISLSFLFDKKLCNTQFHYNICNFSIHSS